MWTIDDYIDSIVEGDPLASTPELSEDRTSLSLGGDTYVLSGKAVVGDCDTVIGDMYRNSKEVKTGTFDDAVLVIDDEGTDKFVKRDFVWDLEPCRLSRFVYSKFE